MKTNQQKWDDIATWVDANKDNYKGILSRHYAIRMIYDYSSLELKKYLNDLELSDLKLDD